ncbi:MAG: OFA family MFS transporter [Gemmatimonadetes bacterium]|nr:OFA family MFS transporter [Gemmatimonadota bacterium]
MGTTRWPVIAGAILIQLCLGALYAWSVFTPGLTEAGWSNLQTQVVFAVGLAMFALVMVFAGKRLPTWGPRRLAVLGGLVLGAGYVVAGFDGGTNFWLVLVGIGLIGGAGTGLGYVVPIAVGMRWFPDHKGLITGVAVAGFGFGAMGWVKLAGAWGNLIETVGIGSTFMIYGGAFAVLVLAGAIFMTMPPVGWLPEGFTPPETAGSGGEEYTSVEMLRTPQFHLISVAFFVTAGAGLMAIGLMKLYPIQALTANGIDAVEASAIAGTAMAVFFSLANGVGRIAWGELSDLLGRRRSVIVNTASQGVLFLLFTQMAGTTELLYLAAALIGFNYGGAFAIFPSITADAFGNESVGANYPWVFLAYGAGGIVFPILGGWLGDLGNFPLAFTICGVACLAGTSAGWALRAPHHDEAEKPFGVHGFVRQLRLGRPR